MASIDDLELHQNPNENPSSRTSEEIKTFRESNSEHRQIKKRNRIPVSCNECRRRKLRFSPHLIESLCLDVIERTPVQHVSKEAKPEAVNSLNQFTHHGIPSLSECLFEKPARCKTGIKRFFTTANSSLGESNN